MRRKLREIVFTILEQNIRKPGFNLAGYDALAFNITTCTYVPITILRYTAEIFLQITSINNSNNVK